MHKAVEAPAPEEPGDDPSLDPALLEPGPLVERFMKGYLASAGLPEELRRACEYALLGGGKRLRPILAAHSSIALGGTPEQAMPGAAAVEMIHAFSLVHDDLPAMDDDDLRRGRPTVHKQFGDAMAILVGDALMSLAFQVIAERCDDVGLIGRLSSEVAQGTTRMIAGQVWDTLGGSPEGLGEEERVRLIHENKTGALIRASCRVGALSAMAGSDGPDERKLEAITRYSERVGLMFQIVDDLLDVEQSAEHTGKRTSKDLDAGKLTFPRVLGIEQSRAIIGQLRREAHESLAPFGSNGHGLAAICDYLSVRTR